VLDVSIRIGELDIRHDHGVHTGLEERQRESDEYPALGVSNDGTV
jgi:hypothetical protein